MSFIGADDVRPRRVSASRARALGPEATPRLNWGVLGAVIACAAFWTSFAALGRNLIAG